MGVPPLLDHELDEPCGFVDDNPYAATSSAMLLQGAPYSYPALHATATGAPQRMPRIPSLTELLNDPSLAHFFEEAGGMQQDMARLVSNPQQQQHAPLLGRPVTSQLLVNNGSSSLSAGQMQQIPQMDPPPASSTTTSAAGGGAAGKRKRSAETSSTASASALSSQAAASAAQKPNGSCFGATFQIGNGPQGSLLQSHQMLLPSNMGMN